MHFLFCWCIETSALLGFVGADFCFVGALETSAPPDWLYCFAGAVVSTAPPDRFYCFAGALETSAPPDWLYCFAGALETSAPPFLNSQRQGCAAL